MLTFKEILDEGCNWILPNRPMSSPPSFKECFIEDLWQTGLDCLYTLPEHQSLNTRDWAIPLQKHAPDYTIKRWERFKSRLRSEFKGYLTSFIQLQSVSDAQRYRQAFSQVVRLKEAQS